MDEIPLTVQDLDVTRAAAGELTVLLDDVIGAAAALSATLAVVHLGREARPLTVRLTALTDRLGKKALFCRPVGEPQVIRNGERAQMVLDVEVHDDQRHFLADLQAVWVTGPVGPVSCERFHN